MENLNFKKLTINLLPPEITQQQIDKDKFNKIQYIGILSMLLFIFLAAVVFGLRFVQSESLKKSQIALEDIEAKIKALQGQESSLVIIKNRLAQIAPLYNEPSKTRSLYKIINELIPANSQVSSFSIISSGTISLGVEVLDISILDNFIQTLTDNTKNDNKIKSISLESLVRTRDGSYRTDLKILAQ